MSGAMENRAAVFTNSPQDVEVYRARAWEPGSMLGWRHAADGSCQAWVRLAAGGAADAVWIDLGDVRLPEPPALRGLDDTMSLVAVPAPATPSASGAAPGPRGAGRRRAPESEGNDSAAYWAALEGSGGRAPELPAMPGRHRAPASGAFGAGRHRAADTEMMPAIRADDRTPRKKPGVAAVVGIPATPVVDEPDSHLYTRPLRLASAIPQPRNGGWDAAGGF